MTPEYTSSPPPSFVNALNYVYREWNYKLCGFVSYGGVSGSLRGAARKAIVSTMPTGGVMAPMVAQLLDAQGVFQSNSLVDDSALDELHKWAEALKPMQQTT